MRVTSGVLLAARWAAAGVMLGALSWAGYASIAWIRYGKSKRPTRTEEADPLLDQLMPTYEVVERHSVRVDAPTQITLSAATGLDLKQSAVIRAIFKIREWMLRSAPEKTAPPRTLLAQATATGWGVLAEIPGREVVVGAVTRLWESNVVFRALPPDAFAAFREPGWVKIAWTLRADPVSASESVARTETRVTSTDQGARAQFRRYWAFFSPGILLIRWISLRIVKKEEAERCARQVNGGRASSSLREIAQ